MHSHLHTERAAPCASVIAILEECHERGFLHKATGQCNAAKRAVNECLGKARAQRSAKNREEARVKRKKTEELWRDIDENS